MSRPATTRKANTQILEEAAVWFVEFNEGDTSSETREAFSLWLRASPEHVSAYLRVSMTFEEAGRVYGHRRVDSAALIAGVFAEGKVAKLLPPSSHSSSAAKERRRGARLTLRQGLLATAAGIVAAFGVAAWLALNAGVYATGIGEQRLVTLADGSSIKLDAATRIHVRLYKSERRVDLISGQALFHVAKDPTRPFIVVSDGGSVRAVGTQFDVDRSAGGTVVTVLEGTVAVVSAGHVDQTSGAAPLYLAAGEQAVLTAQVSPKATHPDVSAATAWTRNKLVFSSSPLSEVVGTYNRYHERHLVIADPTLKDLKISGVFSAADAESLLAFLRAQPNVAVEENAREIVLTGR